MSANSATKKGGKKLHQQPLDSRPFLVWGLGQTGKATARYLANRQRNFALKNTGDSFDFRCDIRFKISFELLILAS